MGISGAADFILHSKRGDSDRVREVIHRKQERYLRRPKTSRSGLSTADVPETFEFPGHMVGLTGFEPATP